MFAYCGNNPVTREDAEGQFWTAIAIGFAVGWLGQYISDVITNISNGETGLQALTPTSSFTDYVASGVGGAIAAIPGAGFWGSVAAGAVGNAVTDWMKGNIGNVDDLMSSMSRGAIANGIGYGISQIAAACKVVRIKHMPRAAQKRYLTDKIFATPRAQANLNRQVFSNNAMSSNIKLLESKLLIYRAGVYSTITSTSLLLARSGV